MPIVLRILKNIGWGVLIIGVLIIGLFWYWLGEAETAHGPHTGLLHITLKNGEGSEIIATRLSGEGIIVGKIPFLIYAIKTGSYHRFQAGEYALSGTMTIPEIIDHFVNGKVVPAGVRITFPEGWTMREIADRLNENHLPGNDFLAIVSDPFPQWRERFSFLADLPPKASLEGYLFPDTYIFPLQATGEFIVNELLENFGKKAAPIIDQEKGMRKLTMHEVVTLASIVEEEGRTAEDRGNISDVFRKRLAVGQALESDATINYIHGTAKDQPTFQDLQIDSLYNTYTHPGLPPGPIGNPGLESIEATLHPTPNPYYYFLIDPKTRITYFAEDFAGHQRNRQRYGL